MTKNHKNTKVSWATIFVLVASLDIISNTCAQGKQVSNYRPKPTGTIKSIEVPEDGDIIDCVLFHKQPAFADPDIKHSPVTEPKPKMPISMKSSRLRQTWHKYGECPKGTVPIRRASLGDIHEKKVLPKHEILEYAQANTPSSGIAKYLGAFAVINVWQPNIVADYEYSTASITIQADNDPDEPNLVEAGWMVNPDRYPDNKPRLFGRWSNGHQGCYNVDCSNFVQTSHIYSFGSSLEPSVYNQTVADSHFFISKYNSSGDWHLQFEGVDIGYWKIRKLPGLADHADMIFFGGLVKNNIPDNHHTATQMGSGHFPSEGHLRAASIHHIKVLNNDYVLEQVKYLDTDRYRAECYDVVVGPEGTIYDTHIYFGGPGYSPQCT